MRIYELLHITDYLDEKHIGYFSSIDNLNNAMRELRKQPGFCRFPHNFFVIPRQVTLPIPGTKYLYEAGIYYHDEKFDVEGGETFGVFGQESNAEEMVSIFASINENSANRWLTVDPSFGRCEMDRVWWSEGFDSYGAQDEEVSCDDSI